MHLSLSRDGQEKDSQLWGSPKNLWNESAHPTSKHTLCSMRPVSVPVKLPSLSPYCPTTPQSRQLDEQGRKDWGNRQTGHTQVYIPTHTSLLAQAQAAVDESGEEKLNFCSECFGLHWIILLVSCCSGMIREIFIICTSWGLP